MVSVGFFFVCIFHCVIRKFDQGKRESMHFALIFTSFTLSGKHYCEKMDSNLFNIHLNIMHTMYQCCSSSKTDVREAQLFYKIDQYVLHFTRGFHSFSYLIFFLSPALPELWIWGRRKFSVFLWNRCFSLWNVCIHIQFK